MDREELARADRRPGRRMIADGAAEEARGAARGRRLADRPGRARLRAAAREIDAAPSAETVEAVKAAHRSYARRQLTWMRRMEGVTLIDRTRPHRRGGGRRRSSRRSARDTGRMRFEKWTGAGQRLRDRRGGGAAMGADIRAGEADLRPAFGVGSDGVLLLLRSRTRPTSPSCGSSTRTDLRRSCPATVPGEAALYLRRAGLDRRRRVHDPAPRPDRSRRRSRPSAMHSRHGPRAPPAPPTSPRAARTAAASSRRTGARWRFQHVSIGNPQCAIEVAEEALEELDLPRSAPRSSTTSCSRTAPTSASTGRAEGDLVRARIFERGVGETLSSGTGACGAAVAAFLGGRGEPADRASSTAASSRSRWATSSRCG